MCRGRDGTSLSGIAVEGRCYSAICIPVDHTANINKCWSLVVKRSIDRWSLRAAMLQADYNEEGSAIELRRVVGTKARTEHENKGVSELPYTSRWQCNYKECMFRKKEGLIIGATPTATTANNRCRITD